MNPLCVCGDRLDNHRGNSTDPRLRPCKRRQPGKRDRLFGRFTVAADRDR